jgi:hypothetical protein
MKRRVSSPVAFLVGLLTGAIALLLVERHHAPEWRGVDEAVIGRFVAEAGRAQPEPIISWVQGDALLFAFLLAGLAGGVLIGYCARALFVETAVRSAAGGGRA